MARRKGNPHFHAAIKKALRAKRRADSNLRRVLRQVQAECSHSEVLEAPTSISEWLGSSPAIRTCRRCGLTEYSPYGTEWGKWDTLAKGRCSMERDHSRKPVLTTEFVSKVTRDEIRRYQCS